MNTLPIPNQKAPIAQVKGPDGKTLGFAYIISPWSNWFQQFSQAAPAAVDVSASSPFTANSNGTLFLIGSAAIMLIRGSTTINLAGASVVIPISIGDTVNWVGGAVNFLGA